MSIFAITPGKLLARKTVLQFKNVNVQQGYKNICVLVS